MSNAINNGICTNDLSQKDPAPISHAMWLTIANRVLRLYISTESTSEDLEQLVLFKLKSYMPLWFKIKKKQVS